MWQVLIIVFFKFTILKIFSYHTCTSYLVVYVRLHPAQLLYTCSYPIHAHKHTFGETKKTGNNLDTLGSVKVHMNNSNAHEFVTLRLIG